MIFVILTVGIAAAAVLGFLLGTQQAEPCACVSAGLPRPTYYGRHDGGIVVGERDEVLVRPVNGRYLGTQPRRTPHPGPFTEVDMPALAEDPRDCHGFPHYFTSEIECEDCKREAELDDDIDPAPPVLGFARSLVYNQACQLDVAEAERLAAVMLP